METDKPQIGGDADAGFKDIRSLGKGGQGQVDKVTSKLDLQTYAVSACK